MTRLDPLWLRVYGDVGGDRYLSHAELPLETAPTTRAIWEIYDRLFGRFTGSDRDPLFTRFAHPADRRLATPILPRGVPIVIAGAGPSLDAACDDLRHLRDRLLIASSMRGAQALQARGLHADLVLVEHPTVFDAQASAEDRRHGEPSHLHPATAVIAQRGTPPALLDDLDTQACYLTDDLPTWGLWPATLIALALEAGAPAIGLVGIDLGSGGLTQARRHPHRPLLALLELLAQASGVCRECGPGSAHKPGWTRASLQALAEKGTSTVQPIAWRHERPASVFLGDARHDLAAVRPLLPEARDAWAMALEARAGNVPAYRDLTHAIDLILAWGTDPPLRRTLERGFGLSFLPRFWRSGIRIGGAAQLWRPVVLALHELIAQVDRLAAIVDGPRNRSTPRADGDDGGAAARDDRSDRADRADPGDRGSPEDRGARADATTGTAPAHGASSASGVSGASQAPDSAEISAEGLTIVASERSAAPAVVRDRGGRRADEDGGRRVTVLLPLKNGLPHVSEALASLVAQTYPDVEILVIDDGSEDGGREQVLARAMLHVRLIPSNGEGIAAALNTGLWAATGAFVARQDADDWSHPERLARQVAYLTRHPEIDLLATCTEFVDAEGRPVETAWTATVRRQYDVVQTPEALARRLPRTCCLQHGSAMARRDVLRDAGGYRAGFFCAQEYDLSLRLLPHARFAKLPARLYTCRVHERQTSQQHQDQQSRAVARAKLEFVLRQAPHLAASARVALAADPRAAEIYRDVWRELTADMGVSLADALLPSSPDAPGADPAAWRDALAQADALLIAGSDRVDAWIAALADASDAGDAAWRPVGICLVRATSPADTPPPS